MKKLFYVLGMGFLMCSCMTTQTVSKVANPQPKVTSDVSADLVVSPTRISYTYVPTAETKKTSFQNILHTAVEEALRENGNADLLVDLKYTYKAKSFLMMNKLLSITVTGFPAKYADFHSLRLKGYTPEGVAMYEEVAVSMPVVAETTTPQAPAAAPKQEEKAAVAEPAVQEPVVADPALADKVAVAQARAKKNYDYLMSMGLPSSTRMAKDYQLITNYVFSNPTEYNLNLLTLCNNNIFMHTKDLDAVIAKYDGQTDPSTILKILAK